MLTPSMRMRPPSSSISRNRLLISELLPAPAQGDDAAQYWRASAIPDDVTLKLFYGCHGKSAITQTQSHQRDQMRAPACPADHAATHAGRYVDSEPLQDKR